MGELRDTARIVGLEQDGTPRRPKEFSVPRAFIDNGSAKTVVSTAVAHDAGIKAIPGRTTRVCGALGCSKPVPLGLALLRIGKGCPPKVVLVAISDEVARNADADVVVGHDYSQEVRMRSSMGTLKASCHRSRRVSR